MTDVEKVLALVGQLDTCDCLVCADCPLCPLCWRRGDLTIGQVAVEWLRRKGVVDGKRDC